MSYTIQNYTSFFINQSLITEPTLRNYLKGGSPNSSGLKLVSESMISVA